MLENFNTVLVGDKIVLVPYRSEHVPNYHEWMQNEALLEATASEPLTLEEEYEMQQSWKQDKNKCTFIVLRKDECVGLPSSALRDDGAAVVATSCDSGDGKENDFPCLKEASHKLPKSFVKDNIGAMIGDVNLFLSTIDEDEEDSDNDVVKPSNNGNSCHEVDEDKNQLQRQQAELDIMIAEADARRSGMATEACVMMMTYGVNVLHIQRYFVKIGQENVASKQMFINKLHFQQCNYVECFREYELEYKIFTDDSGEQTSRRISWQKIIGDITSFQMFCEEES